jgi:NTE family protein
MRSTIKHLVIIVVNAKTGSADHTSDARHTPHILPTVAMATSTVAMDNYSDETVDFVRRVRTEFFQAGHARADCQRQIDARCPGKTPLPSAAPLPEMTVIEVNFDALRDTQQRRYFLALPTSFALTTRDVDALVDVGHQLLRQDPEFQLLKAALER